MSSKTSDKSKTDSVVESLFRDTKLTRQALYSYDDFIGRIVPEVVSNHNPIIVRPSLSNYDTDVVPNTIKISDVRLESRLASKRMVIFGG